MKPLRKCCYIWSGKGIFTELSVRALVRTCPKNCWMVGTAAPVMKKYIRHPAFWVLKQKIRSLLRKPIDRTCLPQPFKVGQHPSQGDLREPRNQNAESYDNYSESTGTDRRHCVAVASITDINEHAFILRTSRDGFAFTPGQNVSIGPHLMYHRNKDFTISSGLQDDYLEFIISA